MPYGLDRIGRFRFVGGFQERLPVVGARGGEARGDARVARVARFLERVLGRGGGAGRTRQVVLVGCLRPGVPALRLQHMHNPPVAESLQPF